MNSFLYLPKLLTGLNKFTLLKTMPTYPIINKETGEKKELSMTMKEYDQWKKDNIIEIS